ncbi:MAG: DUF3570 domain-containing protein, partial [Methylococcaceae bacterium]
MKQSKKSSILESLTLAALALPLMQTANAGRVDENYHTDFQYGHYSESNQRMSVDIFEGSLSAPIGKAITASLNVVQDVISGASPVYNQRDAKGHIQQVISGASGHALTSGASCKASICDERTAVTPTFTYAFDNASVGLSGGYSTENDYTSRYVSSNLSWDINKKLTTLNFSASGAFDELNPTAYEGGFMRNRECGDKCSKTSQQYLFGISQILDKHSLIQSNMTFAYHNGFLSDPYKQVTMAHTLAWSPTPFYYPVDEHRPRERFEWAWLTQYVRHFGNLNDAALHIDYRFSDNDWAIQSHTAELSWHQPIAAGWQIVPRVRYYSQNAANFYQAIFDNSDYQFYSSDYRLAGFGAVSVGLKLSKDFTEIKHINSLKFQAGIEYYDRKSDYQIGGNS